MNARSKAGMKAASNSPSGPAVSGFLHRRCGCGKATQSAGPCGECEKQRVSLKGQAATQSQAREAPHVVRDALRSPGQPLEPDTRAFMESRFGHDFSRVRVHTDARAVESARGINAQAYTIGQDIVFGAGRYDAGTREGKRLLAHELTHVVQQQPVIAREKGDSTDPFDPNRKALKQALNYQPKFRPHVPAAPPVPAPPRIIEDPLPSPCPAKASVIAGLKQDDVIGKTEAYMRKQINVGKAKSTGRTVKFSQSLLQRTDKAIRKEFGSLLPAGLSLTAKGSVTERTSDEFAAMRVPTDDSARGHIGQAAVNSSEEILRKLCITDGSDATLQKEVAEPLFKKLGLTLVREYEKAHIGGLATFPTVGGKRSPHVDIPEESRNLGHILMHEAMHFYVNPIYHKTAEANPNLEDALMEGGAEFLARHVINQQLPNQPDFQINYGTYSGFFYYVSNFLMRGGVSSFSLAYFKGHVDLLGLKPVQPKLEVSQPGDRFEQEADRMAEAVMDSDSVDRV